MAKRIMAARQKRSNLHDLPTEEKQLLAHLKRPGLPQARSDSLRCRTLLEMASSHPALYRQAHYQEQDLRLSHGVPLHWPVRSSTSGTLWLKLQAINHRVLPSALRKRKESVLALLSPRCHRKSANGSSKLNSKGYVLRLRSQHRRLYRPGRLHRIGSPAQTSSWLLLQQRLHSSSSPRRSLRHNLPAPKARHNSRCGKRSRKARARVKAKTRIAALKKVPLHLKPLPLNVVCRFQTHRSQYQCRSVTFPFPHTHQLRQART